MRNTKNIALVAHDNMKAEMVEWARFNELRLAPHILYATGTTGKVLKENCKLLSISQLKSGPLGGDSIIGTMIVEGKLDILFFFVDPLSSQPHDVDIKALMRLAAVYNIPMAINRATADFMISSSLFESDYEPKQFNYDNYINRNIMVK